MLEADIAVFLPSAADALALPKISDIHIIRQGMAETGRALPRPDIRCEDHRTGEVPLRLYRPIVETADPLPLLVFLHGGGWILGDLDTHDATCRLLSEAAGCAILAVAYRLAPEHPFPAGLEDALAAFDWARNNAISLGLDVDRIALGGESAGANLAAAITLMLRDRGDRQPLFQLLVHPATDLTLSLPSIGTVELPGLTPDFLKLCVRAYAADIPVSEPLLSPLHASDVTGLASAIVYTVEVDPLRDDGEHYALALARAGNAVFLQRLPGLPHGFMFLPATLDAVKQAFRLIGNRVAGYFKA